MLNDLKSLGKIGVALYAVSVIAGFILPVPHSYEIWYKFFLGPIGAFLGYGLSSQIVERARDLHLVTLAGIGIAAAIGAAIIGFIYLNLYWASQSPSSSQRLLHAVLYSVSFGFFFFSARWAGLLFEDKKKP